MALNCYTNEVVWIAKKLGEALSLERNDETHKYRVSIRNVLIKNGYERKPIAGLGFTVEDACYDYFRLTKGTTLANTMTNLEVEVV